jgi:hypothetical protein
MKTAIGILDLYDDESLKNVLSKVPENTYVAVISNRKGAYKPNVDKYISVDSASLANMKNLLLYDFRINDLEYYFILHTDQVIESSDIFEKIKKVSETFGTWFLTGHTDNKTLDVEDDNGLILKLSQKLNSKFIFTFKGVVNNIGFFDERFVNTQDLDVKDYIHRLKDKNLYVADGYYPTISINMVENKKTMENSYIKDFPNEDLMVRYSYGLFVHLHKYIPNHSDPTPKLESEVLQSVEFLQKNYAKK